MLKLTLAIPSSPSSLPTSLSLQNQLKPNGIINFKSKRLKPNHPLSVAQAPTSLSLFYFNLCLQFYVKASDMHGATKVFNSMPQRTLISWTILMSGYAKHGPIDATLFLFVDMLYNGSVRPDPFVYSVVLRACAELKNLSFGSGIHSHVLKRAGMVDGFVEKALVNMYASCARLGDAVAVFEEIQRPDLVACCSLLSGYMKNGLEEEGFGFFIEMISDGVELDAFVFSMVIKGCANLENLEFGKQIHCCLFKMGFGSCLFLDNSLMDFYAKCGDLEGLRQVFSGMYEKDLVSWNTLIMAYIHNKLYLEAVKVFRILMEEVSQCDDFAITGILKAISCLGNLDLGREVHGYIIRVGLESNHYVICSLLGLYIECVNHETSSPRDMIPLKLYNYFQGRKFDGYFVARMLKWCSLQSNLDTGEVFHSLTIKLDLKSDPYVISSLIDMYSKCGISEAALRIFQRVEDPGIVAWSTLISGFCSNGCYAQALGLFRKMQFDSIEANEFTFTSVLLACLALNDLRKGRELHCNILRTGYGSNVSVINMLIHLYSDLWHHKQALKLCSLISVVEISWNSLLKACIKAKDCEMVHKLLGRVQLDLNSAGDILNSCKPSAFDCWDTSAGLHDQEAVSSHTLW